MAKKKESQKKLKQMYANLERYAAQMNTNGGNVVKSSKRRAQLYDKQKGE